MHSRLRLFLVIGQGAFLFTGACFLLTMVWLFLVAPANARSGPPPRVPSIGEVISLVIFFVAPAALGAWWIFRKLRAEYPRRQARGAAIAFAVFSPVALLIGLALGPIVGGHTSNLFAPESRLVAFSGAVLGIVVIIALMTFVPSLLALRMMGETSDVNQPK